MTQVPENRRLPLLVAVAATVALVVVALVVVLPGLIPEPHPTPSASESATPSAPETSTPEGATRGFFEAVTLARRTGDAAVLLPHTTGPSSSAFLTIDGFVRGQREAGKASVLTRNEVVSPATVVDGSEATVTFTNRVEGYDIDIDTGEPLESPNALPDRTVTVELQNVNGIWLVRSFEVAL